MIIDKTRPGLISAYHIFLIILCVSCAVSLTSCAEEKNITSSNASSNVASAQNSSTDASSSDASSNVASAQNSSTDTSSRGASSTNNAMSHNDSSGANIVYSGNWISQGVTSFNNQGGYLMTLKINADSSVSGSLGHASSRLGHIANADFIGTIQHHIITANFSDDGWGNSGKLKMVLSGELIQLTVTLDKQNVTGWQLGGGAMPTVLVRDTSSSSSR